MANTEQQNALISVYDKTGIVEFARGLIELETEGWQIIASGGTHRTIREAGLPSVDVAKFVGGEEILGHKVVTLSREISAGLLADLKNEKEMAEMKKLGIPLIHLVCQDSYPLEEAIAEPDATPESVLKQSDIGGPTMLREAAKGGRIVLSVPEQRQFVLEWLRAGRPHEADYIRELADRAVYEVARYGMIEANYWNGSKMSGFVALKHSSTKYGENPQQKDAEVHADNRVNVYPLGIDQFNHVKGWEESFINHTDIYRLVQTSVRIAAGFERNFGEVPPMAIGVKHGNACGGGVGVAETHVEAVKKMIEGDTRAIHGGVVMINGEIDEEIANLLMRHTLSEGDDNRLLDGVVGASVTDEALEILSRAKLRVVVNPALADLHESSIDDRRQKRFLGPDVVLEQDANTFVIDFAADCMEQYGELTEQQKRDLVLAWAIGSTSNSNTITLVKNGMLIGNGVGQQDRVGAGQLALSRTSIRVPLLDEVNMEALTLQEEALFEKIIEEGLSPEDLIVMSVYLDRKKLDGAVAYSDSFFPFADGPTLLAQAGINAFLTTWNTERHKEILRSVHTIGASIAMIPDKVGRGFYGH